MEDIWVNIINNYISFYKQEIKNEDLFSGINYSDLGSTNYQMELLNKEIDKFNSEKDTEYKKIFILNDENKTIYDYVITKNNINYCTSKSLIAVLIELENLKNEDKTSSYNIKLGNYTNKKVKFV